MKADANATLENDHNLHKKPFIRKCEIGDAQIYSDPRVVASFWGKNMP